MASSLSSGVPYDISAVGDEKRPPPPTRG